MAVSRSALLRIAAHVAAWVPFVVASVHAVLNGWRPVSDAAGIALRSWNVLTVHGPLLGQATRLAHGVYDLGPLEYWLLAVPVHLDPAHGAFWGAALWCMVAASLTIEAAWAAGGKFAGVLASLVVLGAILWIPPILRLPCWNPWFGMMFFLAALAAGWAVMTGHRGWWAVLVIAGSIAAQAHLMFAFASAGLVFLALIVGLADTIRTRAAYGWVAAGLLGALACWIAPLVQEVTAPTGNLTALFNHAYRNAKPTGGLVVGLKALAASIQPPALWWVPMHSALGLAAYDRRPAVSGVVCLVLIGAALVVALRPLRSRRVAALAAVSLLISIAAMFTFSGVPKRQISVVTTATNNLNYLAAPMFAVGVLAWLTVVSVLVLIARRVMSRAGTGRSVHATGLSAAARYMPVGATAALVFMVAMVLPGVHVRANGRLMKTVNLAAHKIEARLPSQPITLRVAGANKNTTRRLTLGLAYSLNSVGYRPEIRSKWAWNLGPEYEISGRPIPGVTVLVRNSDISVDLVKR